MLQRIYHEENKKQAMEWENFFANPVTDKGLVPRLYKNSYNLVVKREPN